MRQSHTQEINELFTKEMMRELIGTDIIEFNKINGDVYYSLPNRSTVKTTLDDLAIRIPNFIRQKSGYTFNICYEGYEDIDLKVWLFLNGKPHKVHSSDEINHLLFKIFFVVYQETKKVSKYRQIFNDL